MVVDASSTQKAFIAKRTFNLKPKIVEIYRLLMKNGSDDFRSFVIRGVIKRIKAKGIELIFL